MSDRGATSRRSLIFPAFLRRFTLKVLLGIVLVLAIVLGSIRSILDGYHNEQDALQQLLQFRVTVDARIDRPQWVRRLIHEDYGRFFDRVVELDLSRTSVNEDRGYWQGPENFDDEHVPLVLQFARLQKLNLANTRVSALSIPKIASLNQLEALFVNRSVTRNDAMHEFRELKPNCLICTSSIILATLNADGSIVIDNDRCEFREALPLLRKAALGPVAFGYRRNLQLLLELNPNLVGEQREQMIQAVTKNAIKSGYRHVQVLPGNY